MGACSNFSSKKANNRLNKKEDASNPIIVINNNNAKKEIMVSKNGLPVNPTNEKTPSKNWNNFN